MGALGELIAGIAGLAHSRVEVAGAELREELSHAAGLMVGGLAVLALGGLAVAFASAAVLIAAWETHRLAAAIGLAAFYFAAAGLVLWRLQQRAAARPRPFDATLRTLGHDATVARGVAAGVLLVSILKRLIRARA